MKRKLLFALLFIVPLAIGQKPTPSPTPQWMAGPTFITTTPPTSFTFSGGMEAPRMVIHFSGETVIEINADGKHLAVSADGKVTGDLPHDKAADEFWKDLALALPEMCKEKRKEP